MKRIICAIGLALVASASMAQNVFRMKYETQIAATDLAGTVFNAELLATIRESRLINIGKGLGLPRLRVSVRSMPIEELTTRVSVWDVVFLLDQEDGDSIYLGSWPGYSGDLSARSFARNVAAQIVKQVEDLDRSLTKPKI